MAKKQSRVPDAVKNIPFVGDLAQIGDGQAQWVQQLVYEQARLVVGLPDTLKTLNDSIETFQATVQTLDKIVTRVDNATEPLLAPLEELSQLGNRIERLTSVIDKSAVGQIPDLIESVRSQALPALASATDAQRRVEAVADNLEKLVGAIGDALNNLPGAGLVSRIGGRNKPAEVTFTPPKTEEPAEPTVEKRAPQKAAPAKSAPAKAPAKAAKAPAKKAPAKKTTPTPRTSS